MSEPQTESATPVDVDYSTFAKAKEKGEETFTLRAQDISADLLVDLWVDVQQELDQAIGNGMTPEEAMQLIRFNYALKLPLAPTGNEKLDQARQIAERMRQHKDRKVAD